MRSLLQAAGLILVVAVVLVRHLFLSSPHGMTEENGTVLVGVPSIIRVLTLNVCFKPIEQRFRMRSLAEFISKEKPEIVALQEVTAGIRTALKDALDDEYVLESSASVSSSYGIALLYRKALKEQYNPVVRLDLPLQTYMDRTLSVIELRPNKRSAASSVMADLVVATVHLESLEYQNVRNKQLEQCRHQLSDNDDVVLVGDFNFDDVEIHFQGQEGCLNNMCLNAHLAGYDDAWRRAHPYERGLTFDTSINWWSKQSRPDKDERARYDRCMTRLNSWTVESIGIVGDKPIRTGVKGQPSLFISDHFGLLVTMKRT